MPPPRDRTDAWLRTLVGAGIVVLPLLAQQWLDADRAERGRLSDRLSRVRMDHDVLAVVESAYGPPPPPAGAARVTAASLARLFAEDPATAAQLYAGRRVLVPARGAVRGAGGWGWPVGDPARPSVVRFEFDGPAPSAIPPGAWIEGTCEGRTDDDDGPARNVAGYGFHVRVTGCVVKGKE